MPCSGKTTGNRPPPDSRGQPTGEPQTRYCPATRPEADATTRPNLNRGISPGPNLGSFVEFTRVHLGEGAMRGPAETSGGAVKTDRNVFTVVFGRGAMKRPSSAHSAVFLGRRSGVGRE